MICADAMFCGAGKARQPRRAGPSGSPERCALPLRSRHRTAAATWLSLVALLFGFALSTRAADSLPPPPGAFFNDFAGIVPAATATQLNQELIQFERDSSNQIVVAIYRTMPADTSISDYAVRLFQAWHIGQKGRNNGALLLVFTQSHRMWIETGYGLEGALPDALCAQIINTEIAPRFRAGDYAGGLTAGVHAMIAATRGEYKGTGRTAADARGNGGASNVIPLVFFGVVIFLILGSRRRSQSRVYGRGGSTWIGPTWWGGGWGSGGDSWGGGGGFGGGGGGGFFGGGGSTGGGGAGGSW